MKWFQKKLVRAIGYYLLLWFDNVLTASEWQLCCITYDDNDDDVIDPPYDLESGYFGLEPMDLGLAEEVDKMELVSIWILNCQANWSGFGNNDKQSSDETTYYPSVTTYTKSSGAKKTGYEAYELCHQMADINKGLAVLSQNLDKIAALQKLL